MASILLFRKGEPGVSDAAPLTGYSPDVITEAITLVSRMTIHHTRSIQLSVQILLGIEEWTRDEGFQYNLQDLAVIAAMENTMKLILPMMKKIEMEDPVTWTELGIRIFHQASRSTPKATTVKPLASVKLP